MCVAVCACAHVYTCAAVRVKVFSLCLSKCIFWLLIYPNARERKTLLAFSCNFSQFLTGAQCDPVFPIPSLWSVLHLPEEKVTCHSKCNEHVLEKYSHWHSSCTVNSSKYFKIVKTSSKNTELGFY